MVDRNEAIPKEKPPSEEESVDEEYIDDSDEDENAIIEESPDGRWQRRNRKVYDNDLAGCDSCCAYLAIDSDEGVEVVWNEVVIPSNNNNNNHDYIEAESQIQALFASLIQLQHPNIVKLHAFWTDGVVKKPPPPELIRIIFITEHADTGSLRQFLRNTRKTDLNISKACWRRWCIQVLYALQYLHNSYPPVVHGMLSSQTIFIQSDGVLKIGVVSPRLVHLHMTGQCKRRSPGDAFYSAPEYFDDSIDDVHNDGSMETSHKLMNISTAADIYAFGILALEMLTSDLSTAKARTNCKDNDCHEFKINFNADFDAVERACIEHFINNCIKEKSEQRATALIYDFITWSNDRLIEPAADSDQIPENRDIKSPGVIPLNFNLFLLTPKIRRIKAIMGIFKKCFPENVDVCLSPDVLALISNKRRLPERRGERLLNQSAIRLSEASEEIKVQILLTHPAIFESYSLKVLSAHSVVRDLSDRKLEKKSPSLKSTANDLSTSDVFQVVLVNGKSGESGEGRRKTFSKRDIANYPDPPVELSDFLTDVRNGQYPMVPFTATAIVCEHHSARNSLNADSSRKIRTSMMMMNRSRSKSCDSKLKLGSTFPEPVSRQIPSLRSCYVENDKTNHSLLRVHLFFTPNSNCNICEVIALVQKDVRTSFNLTTELVDRGIINLDDAKILSDRLRTYSV
ncbi:hypothetical protein ACOME3_008737 [Neoechinorhynchus agilis]